MKTATASPSSPSRAIGASRAALRRRPRQHATGREQERDRRRLHPGPVRARSPASASRSRLGMMLRVDEINEQGGINGRKLKLIVEDSGYDPKKAVLAAQKLVNQDKIFADGRPHRHGAEHGRDAGAVREERHQLLPGHGGARNVRAAAPPEVLLRRHLLRPDAHRACPSWSRRRAPRRSAPCTRTTSSAWK